MTGPRSQLLTVRGGLPNGSVSAIPEDRAGGLWGQARINNKIKVLQRMACDYRDDGYFFLKIGQAFPGVGS